MGFVFVGAETVGAITFSGSFSGPLFFPEYYSEQYAELTLYDDDANYYDAESYQIDDFLLSVTFHNEIYQEGEGLNIYGSEWRPYLGEMKTIPGGDTTLSLGPNEEWREGQLIQLNEVLGEGGTLHLKLQGSGGSFTLEKISLSIEASERSPDPVPEPATIVLLAGGVLGLAGLRSKGRWSRA
jgi:hypothetical protein